MRSKAHGNIESYYYLVASDIVTQTLPTSGMPVWLAEQTVPQSLAFIAYIAILLEQQH
jgi:hypothetical protein